jgi:hypothetical protein
MRKSVVVPFLFSAILAACVDNSFYVSGTPDGSSTVDKNYYAFAATVGMGGSAISHTTDIKIYVRAFSADGKLRACGAYTADVDDFRREVLLSAFSQQRAGLVFGKDAEAVSLPLNFLTFNDAGTKGPVRAGCARTDVVWRTSFSAAPELLPMRPSNPRLLPTH